MDERLLLIRQLLNEGDVEKAEKEARKIKDPYWRSYALRWVTEALAENPERAIEVANSIEESSVRDDALRSLAYIFSKNEKFKEALETARKIENFFLRKKAFRAVSNFLARAIATKSIEIRLSDLKLDEKDLEDLKPLPYGIVYKDGKLMPGSIIHRIKGEVIGGILDRSAERPRQGSHRPHFATPESKPDDYVFEYIERLINEGYLEEAEKIAKGLPEPFRSFYLEEIGTKLFTSGDVSRAEKIFHDLEVSEILGSLLARKNLAKPEIALKYLKKTYNPATRLTVAYEITKQVGVNIEFLREILIWATDEWKMGRILKFLAFEMLREARNKGDERLRRISRELFELGKTTEKASTERM